VKPDRPLIDAKPIVDCIKQDVLREVVAYYEARFDEEARLSERDPHGQLELLRTQEILSRYFTAGPLRILDVGGATGVHAFWLARQGHEVTLVDAVPRHVERAREISAAGSRGRLHDCLVGDARSLQAADGGADVVLLLGPLYHLPDRADRLLAMREALRAVRPDGLCFIAAISRYASLLDGYFLDGGIEDRDYLEIVRQDLTDGQHRNTTEKPYFTTAYLHHPAELHREIVESGFDHLTTLPVEGPFWMSPHLQEHLKSAELRTRLLEMLARIEHEPTLLGCSAHLLAVARRPHFPVENPSRG
jgi:SAM-dependent methyltransferase